MLDELKIKKLKWRSRRSMLELDLYFDKFIQAGKLDALSSQELKCYEQILHMDDNDLILLLQGKVISKDSSLQYIIELIKD